MDEHIPALVDYSGQWSGDSMAFNETADYKARDMQLQVTSVGKIIHEVEMHLYSQRNLGTPRNYGIGQKMDADAQRKAL